MAVENFSDALPSQPPAMVHQSSSLLREHTVALSMFPTVTERYVMVIVLDSTSIDKRWSLVWSHVLKPGYDRDCHYGGGCRSCDLNFEDLSWDASCRASSLMDQACQTMAEILEVRN